MFANTLEMYAVELSGVFYFLVCFLMDFINKNMYLQKACRYDATAEPDLDTPCDDESRGISFVTYVNSFHHTVAWIGMSVFVVFSSAWSDQAGKKRKIFIVIAMLAQILTVVNSCVQSYFWSWSPLASVWPDVVLQITSGGANAVRVFSMIHICDNTGIENRTTRLTIYMALFSLCTPISSALSGFMMKGLGFVLSGCVCLVLSVCGLVSCVLLVKEKPATPTDTKITIHNFFDVGHITGSFKVFFKKRPRKGTTVVALLSLINILTGFTLFGEISVFYLYFRYRFSWNERIYGLYVAYKTIGIFAGSLFSSIILSKYLQIHDGLIGAFAGFWDTIAVVCYLFATENWQFYLIPLLDIFHGVAMTIVDSFQTKFFESHEMGQLFCVHQIFFIVVTAAMPVYNSLFNMTKNTFPAAFLLVSLPMDIYICILYSITYLLSKEIRNV